MSLRSIHFPTDTRPAPRGFGWRFVVLGVLCAGCGPVLRASVVKTEQGDATGQECNFAGVWESNDRPRLEATVVSECTTTGALRVVVKAADGSVLVDTALEVQLEENVPKRVETPGFQWNSGPATPITVGFSAKCASGKVAATAPCTLPRKDPPVTYADPPPTGQNPPPARADDPSTLVKDPPVANPPEKRLPAAPPVGDP
jgi:hypothetical protein